MGIGTDVQLGRHAGADRVGGALGLGAAADYALAIGLDAIAARNRRLAGDLRRRLAAIPGVTLHDLGAETCAIVTFRKAGVECEALRDRLRECAINVSVSRASSARIDLEGRGIADLVRASVHYFNTEDEITRLCEAVAS